MRNIFIKFIVNAFALYLVSVIVKGINIGSLNGLIWAVILFGVFNATLKPILILFTLPINLLTLGLFTFFINGMIFMFVSKLVTDFNVADFWSALLGTILLSIISSILSFFVGTQKRGFDE